MAMTGTTKAEESSLPESATITIRERQPDPRGEVEVTPKGGRIHFQNQDAAEYALRFWKTGMEQTSGIDILLPAGGCVTVAIKKDDEFAYSVNVIGADGSIVANGRGGGPIKN